MPTANKLLTELIDNTNSRITVPSGGINYYNNQITVPSGGINYYNNQITVPSGGIQFADATNANTVANQSNLIEQDGYETGTWEPTFLVGGSEGTTTFDKRVGGYVKIGRFVFANFRYDINTLDTNLSGVITIGNFPFVFSTTNASDASGASIRRLLGLTRAADEAFAFGGGYNTSDLTLRVYDNSGFDTAVTNTSVSNSFQIEASISYMTD